MRLTSFEVEGFRNLTAPIRLEELGPINVFHGENNVGKSNLLAAIEHFSTLAARFGLGPWSSQHRLEEDEQRRLGLRRSDVFNFAGAIPVTLSATLELEEQELRDAALPWSGADVEASLRLLLDPSALIVQLTRLRVGRSPDLVSGGNHGEHTHAVQRAMTLLGKTILSRPRVQLLATDHQASEVARALYDASIDDNRSVAAQWERFVETMKRFEDLLGRGEFRARGAPSKDPSAAPSLAYDLVDSHARVPLRAMGSGMQRVVLLVGAILTSGASVLLVEEPEMNLCWALQERVRDLLRDLVGKPGAPSQIFLTSHSGAFEVGDSFFLVAPGPRGPTVERRPLRDARAIVGEVADRIPSAPRAACYLASDGVLRVPESVRRAIGLAQGGGVTFVDVDKTDGVVEVMSDGTFLQRAGIEEEPAPLLQVREPVATRKRRRKG